MNDTTMIATLKELILLGYEHQVILDKIDSLFSNDSYGDTKEAGMIAAVREEIERMRVFYNALQSRTDRECTILCEELLKFIDYLNSSEKPNGSNYPEFPDSSEISNEWATEAGKDFAKKYLIQKEEVPTLSDFKARPYDESYDSATFDDTDLQVERLTQCMKWCMQEITKLNNR